MSLRKKCVVFLFFSVFFILFCCISLWRFNTAQVFYYDFGIFARALWEISQGLPPLIHHKTLGEIHFLGDHFSPSLYILTPLLWVFHSLQILLIEQAFALALSGFIIYLIARTERLAIWISLIVSFVFFIFAGTINPLVTDWHTEPTAAVFLLLFIYLFFYRKKYGVGLASALIFLGWKESNAISFLLCIVPFFILQKKERNKIIYLGCFAIIWFFIATNVIMPQIINQPYFYSPLLPQNAFDYIFQFINHPQKRQLILSSFLSFGFFPLMSIPFLIPIMGELGIRLIPVQSHFQSFTLGMHYNVFLGIFLTLGTIYTLSHFSKKKIQTLLVVFLLIVSIGVAKKITFSPLVLVTNNTFWHEWNKQASVLHEIRCIPAKGSIMSQNNILPHLIQRKEKIYLLSMRYKKLRPDYIVIDLSSGQNPNNFYSGEISEYSQVTDLAGTIKKDPNYVQDFSLCKNFLFLKKRNSINPI